MLAELKRQTFHETFAAHNKPDGMDASMAEAFTVERLTAELNEPGAVWLVGFLDGVLNTLREKEETLYVVPGSDAETHAAKRFPHKRLKPVGSGLRPSSIRSFLGFLPHLFQRHRSEGLAATFQFTFTGDEPAQATITIRDKTIEVEEGLLGAADLHVKADSRTWVGFLRKAKSLLWALIRRKVVFLKGSPRLLVKFAACFPS